MREHMREQEQESMNRSECINGPRPCPHFECRHHIQGEELIKISSKLANTTDPIKVEMLSASYESKLPCNQESCALDVAGSGSRTLEEVASIMDNTRERVRQIEIIALRKMRKRATYNRNLDLTPFTSVSQRLHNLGVLDERICKNISGIDHRSKSGKAAIKTLTAELDEVRKMTKDLSETHE